MAAAGGIGWLAAVSLVLYLAERAAECAAVAHYFVSAQFLWSGWTLGLLLPGCVIQAISLLWFRADGHQHCFLLGLAHVLQLGILKRHVDSLRLVLREKGESANEEQDLVVKQGDLSLLRLLEVLLQALPLLLLQTYIYMTLQHTDVYAVSCALLCLLSLSWALVSFSHFLCLLRPGHLCLPWASVLCQLLWRMGMIGTRVMALVVFARVYHFWVFAVGGAHWLVMSFWLVAQQTDVISTPCYWRLFNILLGAVYTFCFINVRDGPSRYRVAIFYVIMLLENCILLLLATDFLQGAAWSTVKLSVAVLSGFLIGCAALIIYYTLLHPKSTEISQSFKKPGSGLHCRDEESPYSFKWWHKTSQKEAVDDAFPGENLTDREKVDQEDLPWRKVAEKQHRLLLLKLAMKTGNLSKINAAFGEGGIGDLFCLQGAGDAQHPLVKSGSVSGGHIKSGFLMSESWSLGKTPVDGGQGHKYGPQGSSTYDSLHDGVVGNEPPGVGSGKSSEVANACSPSNGMIGSGTLYFSAHTDGMMPSGNGTVCVLEVPMKAPMDTPIKDLEPVESKDLQVMCVSPILSLATNSNFHRSVAEDVGSLCEESEMTNDDSGITEPSRTKGFHLLSTGVLPPAVKGRLFQEEQPCFTSTPKPQASAVDVGPREETKARRRLEHVISRT
ncbi:XK-related protein 5 isoform X1 [Phyllobates terribilis]|uniref:XK-related protein 5 isoform X1 n=1 Tax=Phyllobates terribilis TaxID=111132 RepID=UPI003CCAD00C